MIQLRQLFKHACGEHAVVGELCEVRNGIALGGSGSLHCAYAAPIRPRPPLLPMVIVPVEFTLTFRLPLPIPSCTADSQCFPRLVLLSQFPASWRLIETLW